MNTPTYGDDFLAIMVLAGSCGFLRGEGVERVGQAFAFEALGSSGKLRFRYRRWRGMIRLLFVYLQVYAV